MNYSAFLKLHDELSLLVVIVIILIYDIFASDKSARYIQPLTLVLLTVHTVLNAFPRDSFEVAGGMYQYFPMLTYIKTILNVGTIIIFLQADKWLRDESVIIRRGEFYFITLCTLLGLNLMMSAGHFLLFFIGIETASIPMATLVAFNKYNHKSAEAGAKFILSTVFASGISLYGISMIYGAAGTLYFDDLALLITHNPIYIMALVFFSIGLFFKISLVPFHLWTPDVYEGAPTGITGYLSVISKGSAVFVLFTIFTKVFANLTTEWQPILYGLIVISITLANIFAIRQKNIKRFMAYSSISQAGYLLLGVISASATGMSSMVYYILVYIFSNLAVFGVISVIEQRTGKVNISDYNGLSLTNPRLSAVMMFALFSLAGIPPFAGFFSKFFIFAAATEQGYYVLVFIALINTVISLYYYLLIIKAMFLNKSVQPVERIATDFPARLSLVVCLIMIVFAGLLSSIYQHISALSFIF